MKLFTALENEKMNQVEEGSLEESLLIQTDEINSLKESQQMQEDAVTVGEVIQKIEEAGTPEEALEIAKEHILASIGYNKSFSLENFNNDLNSNLNIAQEGFFGRVGNAFKRAFTSNQRLISKLDTAMDNLKTKGTRDSIIVDPPWSKYLIAKSSKNITSKDVIAYFRTLDITSTMDEINDVLDKVSTIYTEMAGEISKNTFTTSDSTIDALARIIKEADPVLQRVAKLINKFNSITAYVDTYPNYEPIQYKDVSNLVNSIIKAYSLDYKYTKKYESAAITLNAAIASKQATSIKSVIKSVLLKMNSADVNMATTVIEQVDELFTLILDIMTFNIRAAYALVRYIEDSANK